MSDFLSLEEIQLFSGYKRPSKIKEHLRRQGISYWEDRKGNPIVSKEFLKMFHLTLPINGVDYSPYDTEPNLEGI